MNEEALFGRYWPGDSVVHRLDARVKFLLCIAYIVAVFVSFNAFGLVICAVFVIGFYIAAQIPIRQALHSIGPLLFIVIITALLNIFFVEDGTVYAAWGIFVISSGGILSAIFMSIRLLLLLLGVSLLTLTTPTLDMTEAFERIMSPFRRFGLPAHELAMIMGIALRFLPILANELKSIYRAQISRGAHFSANPFNGGLQSLSALIIPLFTSSFRHADTLSLAMESRCYHGGSGRSRLHPLKASSLDVAACLIMAAMIVCIVLSDIWL
ncbi:MAG: energy-coupling factor transporter transmembrane protein EcfT [Eggerthellaceae bacterium]|nr:energy-coupling factor transporter transmembrane protein EcfT [Eggerthellaceae bacterium]